jgi:hypothetical protein
MIPTVVGVGRIRPPNCDETRSPSRTDATPTPRGLSGTEAISDVPRDATNERSCAGVVRGRDGDPYCVRERRGQPRARTPSSAAHERLHAVGHDEGLPLEVVGVEHREREGDLLVLSLRAHRASAVRVESHDGRQLSTGAVDHERHHQRVVFVKRDEAPRLRRHRPDLLRDEPLRPKDALGDRAFGSRRDPLRCASDDEWDGGIEAIEVAVIHGQCDPLQLDRDRNRGHRERARALGAELEGGHRRAGDV